MIRIPADTTIIGEFRCKGTVQIEGRIDGTGNIEGTLLLSKAGVWTGKISADVLVIEGTVEGEIIARRRVRLGQTARVSGRISCPHISIAEGAVVNASIVMRKPEPIPLLEHKLRKSIEIPFLPVAEGELVHRASGD